MTKPRDEHIARLTQQLADTELLWDREVAAFNEQVVAITAERDAAQADCAMLNRKLDATWGALNKAEAERDRLREALEQITEYGQPMVTPILHEIRGIARAALKETRE